MYAYLTREDGEALRVERVLALEADHYRKTLLLAELPDGAPVRQHDALLTELAELERRAAVHLPQPDPVAVEEPSAARVDAIRRA